MKNLAKILKVLILPGCPWYVLRMMFRVNVQTEEAKNIRQVKL